MFGRERGTTPMKVRACLAASGCLEDVDAYLKQASSLEFGLLFVGWMEHMIEVPLSEQRLKNDGPAMTEGTS